MTTEQTNKFLATEREATARVLKRIFVGMSVLILMWTSLATYSVLKNQSQDYRETTVQRIGSPCRSAFASGGLSAVRDDAQCTLQSKLIFTNFCDHHRLWPGCETSVQSQPQKSGSQEDKKIHPIEKPASQSPQQQRQAQPKSQPQSHPQQHPRPQQQQQGGSQQGSSVGSGNTNDNGIGITVPNVQVPDLNKITNGLLGH
jgi:hypothetical protein